MDIPRLGGFRCVEKGVRFFETLFPKNIGLGFWMGFDIWLRLGKNVTKRGWEEGVRILLDMKRWNPGCVGLGDRAKVELY